MANRSVQKAKLAAAGLALLVWGAWLAQQAITRGRFPVVSHSQLLVSTVDVVAEVTVRDGTAEGDVRIGEVLWPKDKQGLVGTTIAVGNIGSATLPGLRSVRESGPYVLPLVVENGKYGVAPVPKSPGFPETNAHFIYADSSLVRRQIADIGKP